MRTPRLHARWVQRRLPCFSACGCEHSTERTSWPSFLAMSHALCTALLTPHAAGMTQPIRLSTLPGGGGRRHGLHRRALDQAAAGAGGAPAARAAAGSAAGGWFGLGCSCCGMHRPVRVNLLQLRLRCYKEACCCARSSSQTAQPFLTWRPAGLPRLPAAALGAERAGRRAGGAGAGGLRPPAVPVCGHPAGGRGAVAGAGAGRAGAAGPGVDHDVSAEVRAG